MAFLTARCSIVSEIWCRRTIPERGSTDRFEAGKTLPEPGFTSIGVLTFKGIRQVHIAVSRLQIVFVQELDFSEMSLQRLLK